VRSGTPDAVSRGRVGSAESVLFFFGGQKEQNVNTLLNKKARVSGPIRSVSDVNHPVKVKGKAKLFRARVVKKHVAVMGQRLPRVF